MLGVNDELGRVFYTYISTVKKKQLKTFVGENVKGLTLRKHIQEIEKIIKIFKKPIIIYEMSKIIKFVKIVNEYLSLAYEKTQIIHFYFLIINMNQFLFHPQNS